MCDDVAGLGLVSFDVVTDDGIYIVLLFALEQTHGVLLACDSK